MRSLMILLLCALASCNENPVTPTAALGTPFSLQWQQTAVISSDGTTVRFERTVSDGRCPSDVMCFWQGEAFIELKIAPPGTGPASVLLPIFGYVGRYDTLAHRPVDTLGYRFTLMQLDPYPKQATPHVDAQDVALIRVSRLTQ